MKLASLVLMLSLVVTATALAGRGDPKKRFSPADQARARAMLLRPADFSVAYRVGPGSSGGGGGFYCAALDESDLTITGTAVSPSFITTGEFVRSSADVYASRGDATASWKRGASTAGLQCLRTDIRTDFRGTAARLVSLKRISFPPRGQRSVAYRASALVQGVRVYVDIIAMQVSRAEAWVIYTAALAPPPQSELVRLSGLVATRAQKAMRGA